MAFRLFPHFALRPPLQAFPEKSPSFGAVLGILNSKGSVCDVSSIAADELDRRRKEGATVVETVGAVEEDVAAKEGAAPRERSVSGVASVGGRAGMPACDRDAMLGSPADVCRVVVAREAPPVSM